MWWYLNIRCFKRIRSNQYLRLLFVDRKKVLIFFKYEFFTAISLIRLFYHFDRRMYEVKNDCLRSNFWNDIEHTRYVCTLWILFRIEATAIKYTRIECVVNSEKCQVIHHIVHILKMKIFFFCGTNTNSGQPISNLFRLCRYRNIPRRAFAPLPIQCDTFLQFYVDESLNTIFAHAHTREHSTRLALRAQCASVCVCLCVSKGMDGKEIVNAVCLCVCHRVTLETVWWNIYVYLQCTN